jgi:signal transduction histidine kinase
MGAIVSPNAYVGKTEGPSWPMLLSVATAAAVVTALLIVLALTGQDVAGPALSAVLVCWLFIPYVTAGLIAWKRRPESRFGRLMVLTGFLVAISFLVWSSNPALFSIGNAIQFLPPALYLHLFLAFPSGELRSRGDRWLVGAAYAAIGLTLLRMIFGEGDSRNLVAWFDEPEVVAFLRTLQRMTVSGLLVLGAIRLILRRRHEGKPLRPTIAYLEDTFPLVLLMLAWLFLVQELGWEQWLPITRWTTFAVIGVTPVVFLVALLQARLGRASVGELLVELGVNPGPAELQEAVARALRDPSATLAYWLPEFDSYADIDGEHLELTDGPGRAMTPIARDGVPVALMLHDAALLDEPRLLASVAAATGMTIQNAQLQVELRARLHELRGSRVRILQAEQAERRRLERDLHDGAQQRLIALSMELGELEDRLDGQTELRERIEEARQELTASLAELRDLAHGIHPATVSDHGLAVALESLATRAPIPVQVIGTPTERLPEHAELAAFFIVSEALTNVAKHARASSAVVELEKTMELLVVEVRDDGFGGAAADTGTGLRGMADRVEALGGRLRVWSPEGQGTRIRAEMPCGS